MVAIKEVLFLIKIYIFSNPFSKTTTISYTLHEPQVVNLSIYNTLGELVQQPLNNDFQNKGDYQFTFDPSILPVGTYHCILQVGMERKVEKMVLIR